MTAADKKEKVEDVEMKDAEEEKVENILLNLKFHTILVLPSNYSLKAEDNFIIY